MNRRIDPLNRIEGDMAIEIQVNEKNKVEDARVVGYVYRGFENIFIGKRPFDAMRMSQRACGVCPVSHGTAGAEGIENAINFKIPRNGELIRDIVLGANIIVSHLTHFYFMWGPDLVNEAHKASPLYPEIMKRFDPLKSAHLKRILKEGRIPLHAVVATFGGKFPHPMHAVPGGVTCVPKHIELIKTNTRLREVVDFVQQEILNGISVEDWLNVKSVEQLLKLMENEQFANSDVGLFIKAAQEFNLHKLGEGSPQNFLSHGFGRMKDGSLLFKSGYVESGTFHELDAEHVTEDTSHGYYESESEWRKPIEGLTRPKPEKEGAYSWIKAPRYFGKALEAGPLARQIVNDDPLITSLVQKFGVNTFTRTAARLHECLLILPMLIKWIDEIDLKRPFCLPFPEVRDAKGVGLVEAPRGALSHWINIDSQGLCKSYQIITPTTWNGSPKDSNGVHGAIEQALIGLKLHDKESVIEAAHVVRSFDPCISCSIHSINKGKRQIFHLASPTD